MAELEEKLIYEQSRTVELKTKFDEERERRQAISSELERTKQVGK